MDVHNRGPLDRLMREIFPEKTVLRDDGKCPICKKPVDEEEFRDTKSRREFELSGFCQDCQDEFFQV